MSFFFFAAFLAWMFLAPPLLIVFCLGAYLFIFQAGPGPQPWVIIMGTYELEQRISAQGFFTFLNWSANAIVLVVYMGISKPLDFYVSLIFGGINLFTFLFLWIFMIDPLRKSPTQILAEYRSKIPIFN
uniref:Glucose transporter type 1 (Trinotate prediction) n=1 Tax=Henneguya salminicola TaxID=69463 RepID=A0A6G3MM43_HENSL